MKQLRLSALAPSDSLPAAFLGLVALYALLNTISFSLFVPGADWAPLWVAGKLSWTSAVQAYDFDLVSSLQQPLVGATTDRPFVYPPSALLLFAPLALIPFTASLVLFILVSLVLFDRASRPLRPQHLLLFVGPPVVLAALAGQPTLLVSALVLFGLTKLDKNESQAGLLIGIAAMIKPPLLLLAPLALAGGGYWRAFASAAATAAAIGALSLAAFGADAWMAWLSALPRFNGIVAEFEPLLRNAITPHAMAIRMDLPPNLVIVCAAFVACPVAWFSFARTHDVPVRLVALIGGALLVTPYAMNYELAALAPAVAALRIQKIRDVIVPELWAASLFLTASLVGLLAVYAWAVLQLVSRVRTVNDFPVQRRVDVPA